METIMVDMMPLNVGVDEVWCNLVAARARAVERQATLRERGVIAAAYGVKGDGKFNENDELVNPPRVWALADTLFALLPDGAMADRMRLVREIEGELGGVR